jgi:hypothetical protein
MTPAAGTAGVTGEGGSRPVGGGLCPGLRRPGRSGLPLPVPCANPARTCPREGPGGPGGGGPPRPSLGATAAASPFPRGRRRADPIPGRTPAAPRPYPGRLHVPATAGASGRGGRRRRAPSAPSSSSSGQSPPARVGATTVANPDPTRPRKATPWTTAPSTASRRPCRPPAHAAPPSPACWPLPAPSPPPGPVPAGGGAGATAAAAVAPASTSLATPATAGRAAPAAARPSAAGTAPASTSAR